MRRGKSWLKFDIRKTKIMTSGPTFLWQVEEGKVEAVTDFVFLGSRITVDGACSHEIKRCLLLERKAMTNLDSILKSRDITLLTRLVMAFLPRSKHLLISWLQSPSTVILEPKTDAPTTEKDPRQGNPLSA